MISDTTICALATATGGALSMIRISGPESWEIVASRVRFRDPRKKLQNQKPNTLHFALFNNNSGLIDEVILSLFKNPHSYTGEDMVELSCHGSLYIQQTILESLIKAGARLATPGEFTKRAFLNGKMDLSQAEAVADLIASESELSHRIAMEQMRGGFSLKLRELRTKLLDFVSLIELELDFSEEDVEFANREELHKLVSEIQTYLLSLLDSFRLGNVLKNGIPVAIIGKPNVGKSTLLNKLVNEEKAIVSEIEGTTRDAIEDSINLEGIRFRFIDTAGIRETADVIENLGIRKTYQKIENSRIIVLLTDARDEIIQIENSIKTIENQIKEDKQLLILVNKTDLAEKQKIEELAIRFKNTNTLFISAEKGVNLEGLSAKLVEMAGIDKNNQGNEIISNTRHFEALNLASVALERVLTGIRVNLSHDFLSQDIREALHYLGEITGEVTTDEILGNIFRNFCIGK